MTLPEFDRQLVRRGHSTRAGTYKHRRYGKLDTRRCHWCGLQAAYCPSLAGSVGPAMNQTCAQLEGL